MSLPLSAHELCESVRQSRRIDLSRLDRVLGVDTSRALVEVQGSVRWRSLAAHLRPSDARAREVRTTRATIGESIAWNTAGPDGRPTVTHVESLTMVTPAGQLRRINRISHPELFALAVGGQGLFGVLYSATLRLESLARALSEAQPVEARVIAEEACVLADAKAPARKLQLLVPPDHVEALIGDTRERCAEWRIPVASVEVRRIRHEEETYLRWAQRDYAEVAVAFAEDSTLGSTVRTTQLRRGLIDAAILRGGAFPIACTPEATRAQTQTCYPQLASFLTEQHRIDPLERMENAWLRHQRSLLGREDCEVRWDN